MADQWGGDAEPDAAAQPDLFGAAA
jgi:hypothetical protein